MKVYFRHVLWAFALGSFVTGCAPAANDRVPGQAESGSLPAAPLPEYEGPATRPFAMGFTPWPADLTPEGVATAKKFADAHGDIISVMFIGGIP
jgi:hypothetical protein